MDKDGSREISIAAHIPNNIHVTQTPHIDTHGFIRADGVVLGRRITEDDVTYLEVKDRNPARCHQLGRSLVRIPFDVLWDLLKYY